MSITVLDRNPERTFELQAFIILYMEIIDQGGEALEKILVHLRDKPEDPCLIHCTGSSALSFPSLVSPRLTSFHLAGKDRAGSFTALVLLVIFKFSKSCRAYLILRRSHSY